MQIEKKNRIVNAENKNKYKWNKRRTEAKWFCNWIMNENAKDGNGTKFYGKEREK